MTLMLVSFSGYSQAVGVDSIFFEAGKTKISSGSVKTLSKITEKVKTMQLYDITLTAYTNKPSAQKPQQSLAMKRLQELCKYLIRQNIGLHIRDIEIVTVNGAGREPVSFDLLKNRIDVTILEQFPDQDKVKHDQDEKAMGMPEADTIIKSAKGTWIKIQGGSFFPHRISDFRFEIKELFTTDDFISNNISTTTFEGKSILAARAFRILALPQNPTVPVPAKFQKPAVVLIPVIDSSGFRRLYLFYQAKDQKSYLTWKKTMDSTSRKKYEGGDYYMVKVNQTGWALIGTLNTSCNCSITVPRLQEQKLVVSYPDLGTVIFLDKRGENLFTIPCVAGEGKIKISVKAFDRSGKMFSLEKILAARPGKSGNSVNYKIRKRDFTLIMGG